MTDAGYSKRPLSEKLGLKPDYAVALFSAPESYRAALGSALDGLYVLTMPLPPPGEPLIPPLAGPYDFIHVFSAEWAPLEKHFPALKALLTERGMLWVSWPKGASKVKTDLDENIVREIGLAGGLVDVKVAAVDPIWSGLKFVYRLRDRSPKP
jgi:hypothetical protein